jgi:hypothetical protein
MRPIVTGATIALTLVCVAPLALAEEPAKFVGGQICSRCHAAETESWQGSHHALAMQKATETAVLGDFANARFEHLGTVTTFSRSGNKFTVNTAGPDGALRDYEIAYTFGVSPLQQYLIAFPGGRYQALGIAWDSRPGGQRWLVAPLFSAPPGSNERAPFSNSAATICKRRCKARVGPA